MTVTGSPPPVSTLKVSDQRARRHLVHRQLHAARAGRRSPFRPPSAPSCRRLRPGASSVAVTALGSNGTTDRDGRAHATVVANGTPDGLCAAHLRRQPCSSRHGNRAPSPDGGTHHQPRCGNGRVDPGETCDIAIAAGDPGACPPRAATTASPARTDRADAGSACTITCTHVAEYRHRSDRRAAVRRRRQGDRSRLLRRPAATASSRPGETCDTAIAAGQPGACPTSSECTRRRSLRRHAAGVARDLPGDLHALPGDGAARSGDGCCPPGGTNAVDTDCPAACGDGVRQGRESCDVGIAPPQAGSCPTDCDDGNACTGDFLTGCGCQRAACGHTPIQAPIAGDGCCPAGVHPRHRHRLLRHAAATASSIRARPASGVGNRRLPHRAVPRRRRLPTDALTGQQRRLLRHLLSRPSPPAAPPATAAARPAARRRPTRLLGDVRRRRGSIERDLRRAIAAGSQAPAEARATTAIPAPGTGCSPPEPARPPASTTR